jgi:hypothetical protein
MCGLKALHLSDQIDYRTCAGATLADIATITKYYTEATNGQEQIDYRKEQDMYRSTSELFHHLIPLCRKCRGQ